MLELIERIRERLSKGAYVNEAAISHGIVTPILNALGWDSADPGQLVPEFPVSNGRVDFALLGLGKRAAVFIEVKGVDRGRKGISDQQLFGYAFHHGVPLCVLTDGREWRFYVPSGQGSYSDRLVYLLQLDERPPEESVEVLRRYLAHDRVRSEIAFQDAHRDYLDVARRREAARALPRAWAELIAPPEDALVGLMIERTEALCGFKPSVADVLKMLRGLRPGTSSSATVEAGSTGLGATSPASSHVLSSGEPAVVKQSSDGGITFTMQGRRLTAQTAAEAMIIVLRELERLDPDKMEAVADALETPTRRHIARTAGEISPDQPAKARAYQFAPGWLVGLTLSNQSKMRIIRVAAEIYGLAMPDDLDLRLPNAA